LILFVLADNFHLNVNIDLLFFDMVSSEMQKEFRTDVQVTLDRLPDLLRVLKPMFVTLTYLEGDYVLVPEVYVGLCEFFLLTYSFFFFLLKCFIKITFCCVYLFFFFFFF
jgi:hypothetical protein